MHDLGLHGAVRGRAWTTTTHATVDSRPDLVARNFSEDRPNQLWVSDFTYVATWRGFVSVTFVTDFVLDAFEQAIYDRCGSPTRDLTHHSDRGTQHPIPVGAAHRPSGGGRHCGIGEVAR